MSASMALPVGIAIDDCSRAELSGVGRPHYGAHKRVWVYFNNDTIAGAIANARPFGLSARCAQI